MMYACALRIFQLRELTKDSFNFAIPSDVYMTCISKGHADRNGLNPSARRQEQKQVHPDFCVQVKEIVDRLGVNRSVFLFGESMGLSHGQGIESLMMDLNEQASHLFCWSLTEEFHGTHVFRHGAAQDAFDVGGVEMVMIRTGHQSQAMALHYAKSDLKRNCASFRTVSKSAQAQKLIHARASLAIEKAAKFVKGKAPATSPLLAVVAAATSGLVLPSPSSFVPSPVQPATLTSQTGVLVPVRREREEDPPSTLVSRVVKDDKLVFHTICFSAAAAPLLDVVVSNLSFSLRQVQGFAQALKIAIVVKEKGK
jgi:hypothetical protein